jgi:hypothetical protein
VSLLILSPASFVLLLLLPLSVVILVALIVSLLSRRVEVPCPIFGDNHRQILAGVTHGGVLASWYSFCCGSTRRSSDSPVGKETKTVVLAPLMDKDDDDEEWPCVSEIVFAVVAAGCLPFLIASPSFFVVVLLLLGSVVVFAYLVFGLLLSRRRPSPSPVMDKDDDEEWPCVSEIVLAVVAAGCLPLLIASPSFFVVVLVGLGSFVVFAFLVFGLLLSWHPPSTSPVFGDTNIQPCLYLSLCTDTQVKDSTSCAPRPVFGDNIKPVGGTKSRRIFVGPNHGAAFWYSFHGSTFTQDVAGCVIGGVEKKRPASDFMEIRQFVLDPVMDGALRVAAGAAPLSTPPYFLKF